MMMMMMMMMMMVVTLTPCMAEWLSPIKLSCKRNKFSQTVAYINLLYD